MPGTTLKITDIVLYCGTRYRVAYYKKRIEDDFPYNQVNSVPLTAVTVPDDFIVQFLREDIAKEKQERAATGLPHARRYRYQPCTQDEATHVSLYGLTCPVAPLEDVTYVGPIDWPPELIAQTTAAATGDFYLKRYPLSDWFWE